jgi:gamma-glutamylaminecyclotransferase
MCVIIVKQKGLLLPKEVAKTSGRVNPHGLGVIWMDTFEITYHKSSEHKVLLTDRPFIAHFRYATVGAINRENTHPFQCNKHEWLMMNGTIYGKGNKKESDSRVLARELGTKPRHTWKKELEQYACRFVTVNTRNRTYQIYNKELWVQRDGIWYSKANVLEEHLVAVYGTLKKGYGNYYRHLTESKFIGKGVTKDKYPLIVRGLPYMIEEKGKGHQVEVEVYKVDDDTFRDLDALEGHPQWYCRKQIPIKLGKGNEVMAWLYFNPHEKSTGHQLHKSYEGQVYSSRPKYQPSVLPFWEPEQTIDDIPEDKEFIVDEECPVCINCFHDLEHDFYGNFYCKECGEWFSENEVIKFGYSN